MSGPYQSEADALGEPMPREVAALHDAGLVRAGDPNRVVRDVKWRHLTAACDAAGVELGEFDREVLAWLCGWEPKVVQVVIGLVERAARRAP